MTPHMRLRCMRSVTQCPCWLHHAFWSFFWAGYFADVVDVQLARGTLPSLSRRDLWAKLFIQHVSLFGEFGWRQGPCKFLHNFTTTELILGSNIALNPIQTSKEICWKIATSRKGYCALERWNFILIDTFKFLVEFSLVLENLAPVQHFNRQQVVRIRELIWLSDRNFLLAAYSGKILGHRGGNFSTLSLVLLPALIILGFPPLIQSLTQ